MEDVIKRIRNIGILPVVKIDNADDAVSLAEALKKGGLGGAEITFRTAAAEDAIRRISKALPDFLIGAGTVLSEEQADTAVGAGASFIVSPGLNPAVVKHCIEKEYTVIPGICTPTEAEAAMSFGLRYVKFFPAEAAGGVNMIKAMSAPYTMLRFMPTGGINASNAEDYLSCRAVFACGGSWMVKSEDITSGEFEKIACMAREAFNIVENVRRKLI